MKNTDASSDNLDIPEGLDVFAEKMHIESESRFGVTEPRTRRKKQHYKSDSDLNGPLKKMKTPQYVDLITPLHVELLKLQNHI
ncbi:MAG: hypothetical protein ACI8S6_004396, partial [Myxococcota bacterium]